MNDYEKTKKNYNEIIQKIEKKKVFINKNEEKINKYYEFKNQLNLIENNYNKNNLKKIIKYICKLLKNLNLNYNEKNIVY